MKFIVSASVIVLNEHNEILLMKGRRGWEMPQGCVEEGETIRQTAVREVKEKTNHTTLHKLCIMIDSTLKSLFSWLVMF